MNLTDIPKETRLFALFIGRSGSGKTIAAASLPKPLQELDFDIRANGLINAVNQGWLDDKDIDIKQFDPLKGWLQVQNHLEILYNLYISKQFNYKSIDIGSLTSLSRLLELTSLNTKDKGIGHLNLAGLTMTGYQDYRFETQAFHRIIDYIRIFPCNITISGHIIDKYGKKAGAKEADPSTIIGEKLTLSANIAENILACFNDVYRFSKEIIGTEDKYFIEFNTEIAKNRFGIAPGKFDITQKSFWNFCQELVASIKNETFKPPTQQNQNSGGGFAI